MSFWGDTQTPHPGRWDAAEGPVPQRKGLQTLCEDPAVHLHSNQGPDPQQATRRLTSSPFPLASSPNSMGTPEDLKTSRESLLP